MLALILGFLANFLPDLVSMGKTWMDNRHEKEMLTIRLKGDNDQAAWRAEAVVVQGDTDAFVAAHKQQESFGVKLLDAGRLEGGKMPWYLVPVMWLFAFVDFLNAAIRPGITIAFIGAYLATKVARVTIYQSAVGAQDWAAWAGAMLAVWDETDRDILQTIVGFWFGRIARGKVYQKG